MNKPIEITEEDVNFLASYPKLQQNLLRSNFTEDTKQNEEETRNELNNSSVAKFNHCGFTLFVIIGDGDCRVPTFVEVSKNRKFKIVYSLEVEPGEYVVDDEEVKNEN